jgi:hypothetical protein
MNPNEFHEKILDFIKEKKEKVLYEAIEQFRTGRINELKENRTQKDPFSEGPKLVLHLIPLASFQSSTNIDLSKYFEKYEAVKPIRFGGLDQSYNFDGLLHFSSGHNVKCDSYVQVYRDGIIEAVDANLFDIKDKVIYTMSLIRHILDSVNGYLAFQKEIEIKEPILLFISLLGIQDYMIPKVQLRDISYRNIRPIDRGELNFPGIRLINFSLSAEELKPLMDCIWNACGCPKSADYDENGKLKGSK